MTSSKTKKTEKKKKKPTPILNKEGQWVGGVWIEPIIMKQSLEPETPETKLRQRRACAMIMAQRFGIRDWHRKVLTPDEIEGIEEGRR